MTAALAKGASSGRALQEAHGTDGHIEGLRETECRPRSHSKKMPVRAASVMSCLPELKLTTAQPLSHSLVPPHRHLHSCMALPSRSSSSPPTDASKAAAIGFGGRSLDFGLFLTVNPGLGPEWPPSSGKGMRGQAVTVERALRKKRALNSLGSPSAILLKGET